MADNGASVKLVVSAGNGGEEAQDWAQTLYAMYLAWARAEGLLPSYRHADRIMFAHGEKAQLLRTEAGIHRQIRRSKFDPAHRRHTSFASVTVENDCPQEQVRSYVLYPYRLVTDHRTGYKVKDVHRVLRGCINGFLRAANAR